MILNWLQQLDQILRGEKTRMSALRQGEIDISLRVITLLIVLLGVTYGVCMGAFALLRDEGPVWQQMLASAIKVPALFLLTLAITFPSLYVFNSLVGSRLRFTAVLKLLISGLAVTLAMLAASGPIVAFFSLSTKSYAFMVLLNVLVFGLAGSLGLRFVLQTLHRLTTIDEELRDAATFVPPQQVHVTGAPTLQPPEPVAAVAPTTADDQLGPLEPLDGSLLGGQVQFVFRCWVLVFGLVGAQMSWVLRPYIGSPGEPFTWFRERDSNFFEAVWGTLMNLFYGT